MSRQAGVVPAGGPCLGTLLEVAWGLLFCWELRVTKEGSSLEELVRTLPVALREWPAPSVNVWSVSLARQAASHSLRHGGLLLGARRSAHPGEGCSGARQGLPSSEYHQDACQQTWALGEKRQEENCWASPPPTMDELGRPSCPPVCPLLPALHSLTVPSCATLWPGPGGPAVVASEHREGPRGLGGRMSTRGLVERGLETRAWVLAGPQTCDRPLSLLFPWGKQGSGNSQCFSKQNCDPPTTSQPTLSPTARKAGKERSRYRRAGPRGLEPKARERNRWDATLSSGAVSRVCHSAWSGRLRSLL